MTSGRRPTGRLGGKSGGRQGTTNWKNYQITYSKEPTSFDIAIVLWEPPAPHNLVEGPRIVKIRGLTYVGFVAGGAGLARSRAAPPRRRASIMAAMKSPALRRSAESPGAADRGDQRNRHDDRRKYDTTGAQWLRLIADFDADPERQPGDRMAYNAAYRTGRFEH